MSCVHLFVCQCVVIQFVRESVCACIRLCIEGVVPAASDHYQGVTDLQCREVETLRVVQDGLGME